MMSSSRPVPVFRRPFTTYRARSQWRHVVQANYAATGRPDTANIIVNVWRSRFAAPLRALRTGQRGTRLTAKSRRGIEPVFSNRVFQCSEDVGMAAGAGGLNQFKRAERLASNRNRMDGAFGPSVGSPRNHEYDGLADIEAANPFRLLRNRPRNLWNGDHGPTRRAALVQQLFLAGIVVDRCGARRFRRHPRLTAPRSCAPIGRLELPPGLVEWCRISAAISTAKMKNIRSAITIRHPTLRRRSVPDVPKKTAPDGPAAPVENAQREGARLIKEAWRSPDPQKRR